MNDRNFDQLLDAWMDLGPHVAPARVAEAVRLEAGSTRQLPAGLSRLATRRFPEMNQSMRIALAAAAVVAVALIGFGFLRGQNVGNPGPSASVAWVTFTSERYAYAIDHPADWRSQVQGGAVLPTGQQLRAPGTDLIGSSEAFQTDDGLISISAHDLEPGETLSEFTDRFSASAACGEVSVRSGTRQLGGEEAEERDMACGVWAWLQVTALHGDRGYAIWLVATAPPDPEQRPINDQILATFRFTD